MKFISILFPLSLAGIAAAEYLPYCTGIYAFNHKNCGQFQFNGKPDHNSNAWNPRNLNLRYPSKFSSSRVREYAVAVTNIFENNQISNDYATCVNIGDGRGYTCGSAGFTSDDGSMLQCLNIFANLAKSHHKYNPFLKYMSTLKRLSNSGSGSTSSLSGLNKVWTKQGCTNSLFIQAQDRANFNMIDYWSNAHAAFAHVRTNLGLLVFRDTMVMHGDGGGEPHISTERIMDLTRARVGKYASEHKYIAEFLKIRRQMACCYRPYGDLTWPEAADRLADLQSLVSKNNWSLKVPFTLPVYGFTIQSNVNIRQKPAECNHI